MTRYVSIDALKEALCQHDEDYEYPCITPSYLEQELEQLAVDDIPTTKNNLGVEEVTALAEWTEKLTKASEDAYNKGYADGMKAQEPILDKIYADIQRLRGCSCSCSDGIIDDIEDILDKYKAETEE